jgi:3-phenylpropionate/trans-cinnamate dioxygenase ferredoxin reductase subunit
MTAGIVIIGAGEAGGRAALALRERQYEGPLTLIGEELHLPYERPPLSKTAMTMAEEPLPAFITSEAELADKRIRHLSGVSVVAIDRVTRQVQLSDGSQIAYEKLLLATGARPRKLTIPGAEQALYLRHFGDALALRARLAPGHRLIVIGGGFIGLELAASAQAKGCQVTVLEMAPRILGRAVPAEVAAVVATRHRAAGIEILEGVGIVGIETEGSAHTVILVDGRRLPADTVIAGIGALPETALAEAAGLATENGIRVDERMMTEDAAIFAAGDCCSFPHPVFNGRRLRLEAWRNACDQARHVAGSMLGETAAYDTVPWFWSDQHDETLQIAGLPDEGEETVARDLGGTTLFFHLKAGRLVGASAFGPIGKVAKDIRLAEMMIQAGGRPSAASLADPAVKLKTLLRADAVA